MFWEYWSSCAKHDAAASVSIARVIWTYICDLEPSSSLMSAETSFDDDDDDDDDDDSNKEALNVNKIFSVITANKMGCKLYSNIISPNPTEGATENIGEGLHY